MSEGRRSEVELSTLPEVAALATELTTLFKDLGLTQQEYAIRTNFDKSYVSRFLKGRRVATVEFIERLLQEVEKRRGVPITDQTRVRLFDLRFAALRAYDPELYRLECLRHEVDKTQRDVKRLLLHQEALENLLERREKESENFRKELQQLNSDWVADRVASEASMLLAVGENQRLQDERDTLREEILKLKEELRLTVDQKNCAEKRCAELEGRVAAVERRMAEELEKEGIDELGPPVKYLQARILELSEVSPSAVYRELSECALSRASRDIAQLYAWLKREMRRRDFAEELLIDYCRQRTADRVAQLVLDVEDIGVQSEAKPFGGPIANDISRRTYAELLEFSRILVSGRDGKSGESQFVHLAAPASAWLLYGHSPRRISHLLSIIEELISLGEKGAAILVTQRVGARAVRRGTIMETLGSYEREDIVEEFIDSFVSSVSVRGLNSTAEQVFGFPDPTMAKLLMSSIKKNYDLTKVGNLVVDLHESNGSKQRQRFRDVLVREAVEWYGRSELLGAVEARNVFFVGGGPDMQAAHDTAQAAALSAVLNAAEL
ncbi:helix-turn-helix domain-containing protein [Streptomyces sp. NPDC001982]|uniref:helix-turn-helix domain-containing protein n=1 Tax=Streptomyces sp. NPDC001982 TaxID=3154405 RepID=UPI003324CBC9